MIELDGSAGEGGGQMLRTALSLSAVTGKAFRMVNIRANRPESGLKAQHLHCIEGMKQLCDAAAEGAVVGSSTVEVIPRKLKSGTVKIDIGTAGSITLVLQALLLPALFAGKTTFRITGGTDVAWSPPIDFLSNVILPHLRKYAEIRVAVQQRGYYPAGGGMVELKLKPKFDIGYADELFSLLPKFRLLQQGKLLNIKGISHAAANLQQRQVAERQASAAQEVLAQLKIPVQISTEYARALSSGSGITLWAQFGSAQGMDFGNPVILGADCLGERGKAAELVGKEAAQLLQLEMQSMGCVDRHTTDWLIPFLGIFGGEMKVSEITEHTRTNIFVAEKFLERRFEVDEGTKIIRLI